MDDSKAIQAIRDEDHWYKKSQLILQFHNNKIGCNGNKRGTGWTIKKTAAALNLSLGYVCESLVLAHCHDLKGLSRNIALKVVRDHSRSPHHDE